MNFLSKKYTQLTPIEELPKEKELKKENFNQIPYKNASEAKLKTQPRKMHSANSQNNFNESTIVKNGSGLDARDFLWDNNYKIKLMINQYKDDNSKQKAKIGNLEVFGHVF